MQSVLTEKLRAYVLINNPDLAVQLQADYSVTQYLEDKVLTVMPMVESLLKEDKPVYIIEELCLQAMTADLRPSRFNYIKGIIEEEFTADYDRLVKVGVLTYETINLIGHCKEAFDNFAFSEETEDNRFLRYAVIAAVHDYFN
jgi:hypothetical protein